MKPERTRYREVELLAVGSNLPGGFIKELSLENRVLIEEKLKIFEQIQNLRAYKPFKRFPHGGELIHQLTCGNFRIYFEFVHQEGKHLAVVCYICKKKKNRADKKDLNRVVTNMRVARDSY